MERVTQTLVRQQRLQQELDLSRSGLYKLQKNDPSFPRPVKLGSSVQSPVFFVRAEIEMWLSQHLSHRNPDSSLEDLCDL